MARTKGRCRREEPCEGPANYEILAGHRQRRRSEKRLTPLSSSFPVCWRAGPLMLFAPPPPRFRCALRARRTVVPTLVSAPAACRGTRRRPALAGSGERGDHPSASHIHPPAPRSVALSKAHAASVKSPRDSRAAACPKARGRCPVPTRSAAPGRGRQAPPEPAGRLRRHLRGFARSVLR